MLTSQTSCPFSPGPLGCWVLKKWGRKGLWKSSSNPFISPMRKPQLVLSLYSLEWPPKHISNWQKGEEPRLIPNHILCLLICCQNWNGNLISATFPGEILQLLWTLSKVQKVDENLSCKVRWRTKWDIVCESHLAYAWLIVSSQG